MKSAPVWYDVCTIQKKPIKVLGSVIHTTVPLRGSHGTIGEFDYPAVASMHVPDITRGNTICLLQY